MNKRYILLYKELYFMRREGSDIRLTSKIEKAAKYWMLDLATRIVEAEKINGVTLEIKELRYEII